MKSKTKLRSFLALSGSVFFAASQAHAAAYYWDTNGNAAGLGDTAGTWGTDTFWGSMNAGSGRIVIDGTQSTANTTIAVGDTVYFGTVNLALGSTASTIGIVAAGSVNVNRIVFGAGQGSQGVTLSGGGGTITLSNSGASIVANNTGTNTIGAVLINDTTPRGLLKGGSGTVVLTGANDFTGGVTVTGGGTLQVGDGTTGSLTSQNLTFHSGGGTFNVRAADAGSTHAMETLTFANTGATAGEGTIQSTYGSPGNAELSFSSLAARQGGATGNFVISGGTNGTTNKIVLTGAATGFLDTGLYFGGNSFAAYDAGGFVRGLIYGSDANTAATDTITASNHVQLTTSPAARAGDTLLSLNLSGGGVDYTMNSGSLIVPAILKSGGSSASTISGGDSLTTASNAELVIRTDTSSDLLTISSAVTGFSGGLTKTGAGTLTLSGSNGYTGATRINAGTLAVSGGSAIADNQTVTLANAAGATFKLNNDETILSVTGGGISGGTVDVQGNTLTLSSNAAYTYSGIFSGTNSGGIIKQGAGTLTLSNTNTFAGTTTLEGGAIEFTYGNDGTGPVIALSSGGAFNMGDGTTLRFKPTANLPSGVFGSQFIGAVNRWTFSNDINIATGTANVRFDGNENGFKLTGNVTGGTSGAQTLAIYQGGIAVGSGDRQTIVSSGTIANGSGGTLGVNIDFAGASSTGQKAYVNLSGQNTFTGPLVVTNSKGLVATGTNGGYVGIGGEVTGTSPTFITGDGYLGGGNYTNTISLAAGTILTYLSSANQTLGGDISGSGALIKRGGGTLTLSVANSYTGTTTVNDGALLVNNTTGSGTGAGNVTVTAGTLGGTGSISGTVTIGNGTGSADAILAPGTSIESLDTGALTFASDGSYAVELDGTSVTSDQTNVTGTVAINASTTLSVNVTGTLSASQQYVIVSNDGVDAVTGTFSGFAQDVVVGNFGGTDLKISYSGGDGNDIVLYTEGSGSPYSTWAATNAPSPQTPDGDFDGDGVSNAVEFVLGGDKDTNDLNKLPTAATSGTDMTFTFVRDETSVDADVAVTIEVSNDLVTWTAGSSPYAVPDADTAGPVNPGVTVVDNGATHTVTLTIPQAPDTKKFARLKVVITP